MSTVKSKDEINAKRDSRFWKPRYD